MSDFWENIKKFPRFFISSILGLVFIIIGPFLNLARKPDTTIILIICAGTFIFLVVSTLKAMLGLQLN